LLALQALPTYQLALPFAHAAGRQLEYTSGLAATTLGDFRRTAQLRQGLKTTEQSGLV